MSRAERCVAAETSQVRVTVGRSHGGAEPLQAGLRTSRRSSGPRCARRLELLTHIKDEKHRRQH